jgi:hypothetical protein
MAGLEFHEEQQQSSADDDIDLYDVAGEGSSHRINFLRGMSYVPRDSIHQIRHNSTYATLILKEVDSMGYEGRSWNMAYLKVKRSSHRLASD